MVKKLVDFYKIPLLISVTIAVVLIGVKVEREVLGITAIVLGTFFGTLFLDLDYFIYAFFLEPQADFSKTLAGYLHHGDFGNALSYIYYHKSDVKEKTLNSVFFQLVLAVMSILVLGTTDYLFVKALVLTTFANSIYRMLESYFENKGEDWFWSLKSKPTKTGVIVYTLALGLCFVYGVSLF